MEHSERSIAHNFGVKQRRNNVPRCDTVLISELVYSTPGDYYLRRITLEGYDERDAELAAEMS